jgi:glutamyl/glutaminyl-tRNA synthetase
MHTRTEVFNRVPDMVRFLAELPEYDIDLYTHKKMKTNPENSLAALKLARPALAALSDFTEEPLKDCLMVLAQQNGLKTGQMMWPVRVAVSGQASTPGGATEIAYLLGKEETLRRIDVGITKLGG